MPLKQSWFGPHRMPQPPQLSGSNWVMVHVAVPEVRQTVVPNGQPQAPLEQMRFPGQTFPQLPQFERSKLVLVHRSPQSVWPPEQPQLPLEQVWLF